MENTNNCALAKSSQNVAAGRWLETWRPSVEGEEKRGGKPSGNHVVGLALLVSVARGIVAVKQIAAAVRPK
jgi:hypothetical protein